MGRDGRLQEVGGGGGRGVEKFEELATARERPVMDMVVQYDPSGFS